MKEKLRSKYSVLWICKWLDVSPSSYYAWDRRPDFPRKKEDMRLEIEIKAAHKKNRVAYDQERLQADLADHCVQVGIRWIKLEQKFTADAPDRVRLTDST